MNLIRTLPYRAWLLVAFGLAFAVSAIGPAHPRDFVLEHTFTLAAIVLLVWLERAGRPLTNASCTAVFAFLLLHVLGAHYTYSEVPYDRWSQSLFGTSLNDMFNLERNHYDRLVHLAFGLLMTIPMRELTGRMLHLHRFGGLVVTVAFIGVLSKVYELIEWGFAEIMSDDAAEMYNGQQGDMYDAQKDMALALVGSIFTACILAWKNPQPADSG